MERTLYFKLYGMDFEARIEGERNDFQLLELRTDGDISELLSMNAYDDVISELCEKNAEYEVCRAEDAAWLLQAKERGRTLQ